MRDINAFVDKHGHIAQGPPHRDGGDSFSFAGQVMVAFYARHHFKKTGDAEYIYQREQYLKRLDKLRYGYGIYLRHNVEPEWATKPDRMSRDQMTANIAAMGFLEQNSKLWVMLLFLIFRLGFATNTRANGKLKAPWKLPDFCGPKILGMFIRALKLYPLYPLLLLTDLHMLIDSIVQIIGAKKNPEDTNETNHIVSLLQSTITMPTLISYLARKIYRLRPLAPQGKQRVRKTTFGPQSALDHFFSGRNEIEPPIDDLYRPLLEELL